MKLFFFAVLASCAFVSASQAQTKGDRSLGRVFFTPERRATLDRQRQLNLQETQALQGSSMSLDGVVRRSSGRQTVWINGRPQNDNTSPSGVTVTSGGRKSNTLLLNANGEAPAELRVGETINRATRDKDDGLRGGVLLVKPLKQ